MSSRLPLQPHPDGWLSASKPAKLPTQRPLVKLDANVHHGISTPPSSTSRKRPAPASNLTASQRKRPRSTQPQATPTAAANRTLDTYLTPPTTTGKDIRRRKPLKPITQNPQSDAAITQWLSEPPARGPLRDRPTQPLAKPSQRARSTSRSPAKPVPRTPENAPLTQRELTQVPASVLARHQRLCGQDSARRRATRSPWREITEEDEAAELEERRADRQRRAEEIAKEKERKRLRLDVRENVEKQAKDRIEGVRQRRALGQFKSLVHLSSESSSSPHSSSPTKPGADSKRGSLRPFSSAIEEPVCERETQWPKPQVLPSSRLAAMPRRTSPFRPYIDRPRDSSPSPSKRSLPGASPQSKSPVYNSPDVTTPKKPKRQHHQVTPPKSRSPQGNQPETLFVFPLPKPPPQPVFVRSPRPFTNWRPVEMEAETLMTWSLGGGAASAERNADLPPSDPPVEVEELQVNDNRHELPPSDPPALPPSDPPQDSDETESIAPSVPSQTFPDLLHSSPARQNSSPKTRGVGFPLLRSPPRLPRLSVSPGKRLVRRSGSPKRINEAIFASLSDTPKAKDAAKAKDTPKAKPPPPSQKRQTKRSSQNSSRKDSQQTKLDVFGYFPQREKKVIEFHKSFSDEEDLDFGDEHGDWTPRGPSSNLGRVPEAPPHPSLREAGRRELAKCDAEAMERHRLQQRPPTTPYTDSSSLTPDEGPQTSESTRRWFAGLDHSSSDHSSEL